MKRIISVILALPLALALMLALAAPVFASEADESATAFHHVQDPDGKLSEKNRQRIENAAKEVLEKNGVDLFAYISGGSIAKPDETGSSIYHSNASADASVILLLDKKSAYIKAYGRAEDIFTKDELKAILKQAKKQDGSAAKCMKFIALTGDALTEKGVQPIPEGRRLPRLVDDADLLTESEESDLLATLDEISEKQQLDVVIVTNHSLEGKSVDQFADDFFDYNGYGYGDNDDGILLLLSMDTREWAISTYGKAIEIFTDSRQSSITDQILSYFGSGDYYRGFSRFAALCDETVEDYHENGNAYSSPSTKPAFNYPAVIVGSIVAGLIAGLIVALVLKSQLTSVKPQAMASAYAKKGSMKLTEKNDLFLYHTITRVARPKETSSSGSSGRSHSSSTHTSSSGRSHGGSHGHF